MGMIQSAINSAIGSATTAVGIAKGVKAVEGKKATDAAETQIKIGQTQEKIAGLEKDVKANKEERKGIKANLDLAKQGFEMVELDGHQLKSMVSGDYQNELIKRYQQANRESLKMSRAIKNQLQGYKMKLEVLQGGNK